MQKKAAYLTLIATLFISLMSTIGIALPYPIFAPLFLDPAYANAMTNWAGVPSKLLLASLLAIYPLGLLVGSSFIGALSDVYGRKITLQISQAFSLLGYLLTAYALVTENFPLLFVARGLTGMFEGNHAVARAIALDLHPVIERSKTMSYVYACTYAGWLIGPLAGGYLMLISAEFAFYIAGIALLLCMLLTQLYITNTISTSVTKTSFLKLVVRQNSFGLLKQPDIMAFFLLYLAIALGINAYYEFYPLWLVEHFSYNSVEIGQITVLLTVLMILTSSFVATRLQTRFGYSVPIYSGLGLMVCLLLVTPWLQMSSWLFPYFALCGIAVGLYNAMLTTYITVINKQQDNGRLMGLIASTFYLANVLMAMIGGLLTLLGTEWAIFSGGIVMFIGLLLLQRQIVIAKT